MTQLSYRTAVQLASSIEKIDEMTQSEASSRSLEVVESIVSSSHITEDVDLETTDLIDYLGESLQDIALQASLSGVMTVELKRHLAEARGSIASLSQEDVLESIYKPGGKIIVEGKLDDSISSGDLVTSLDLTPEEAKDLIEIMKGARSKNDAEIAMRKIDFILHERDPEDAEDLRKADNVEAIKHELLDKQGYWGNTAALYVNTGDTYNATVVYDVRKKKFLLTDYATFSEHLDRSLVKQAFDRTFDDGIEAEVEASVLTKSPFDSSKVRKVIRRNLKCGSMILRVDGFEVVDAGQGETAIDVTGSLERKMTRDLRNSIYRSEALQNEYGFEEFKKRLSDEMKAGLEKCLREYIDKAEVKISDVIIHEFALGIKLQVENELHKGDRLVEALSQTSVVAEANKMPLPPKVSQRAPDPFKPFKVDKDTSDSDLWCYHDGQFLYGEFETERAAREDIKKNHTEPFEINQFGEALEESLDHQTLNQLVGMEARSMGLENRESAHATSDLLRASKAFEKAVHSALEKWVEDTPPHNGASIDDLIDANAVYAIFMTLEGHGVGIWDGRWKNFYSKQDIDRLQRFLEMELRRDHDELKDEIIDAAFETAS